MMWLHVVWQIGTNTLEEPDITFRRVEYIHTLKMEEACFSTTLIYIHQTARLPIPENRDFKKFFLL
jgi:hypothetical protein